ncbi:MAG: hypothetical protein LQ352_002830 [Teloschistes flavicans]|nr:MAG: hypothetical protein LQ352_002830 [Teloschistes flavicans]
MPDVFAVPIFFIVFRETVEVAIIVSLLLSFQKQTLGPSSADQTSKKLRRQIWYGTLAGFLVCLVVGGGMIGAFYGLHVDHWAATEPYWEGSFSIIASLIIAIMGAALLRISKLQAEWRAKLIRSFEEDHVLKASSWWERVKAGTRKYFMFWLPFITVLREGAEAIVFIAGVGLSLPGGSIPLPVVVGLAAGAAVGFIIYKGGNFAPIHIFLVISTCFLYLVAAGLFSKGVWYFESGAWNKVIGGDAAETGSGPGSYDIRKSVWHVNCCNPYINGGGGWGIFNAIFGWQNSATYGSVISYNLFWLTVIVVFLAMGYQDSHGHWPLMKPKPKPTARSGSGSGSDSDSSIKKETHIAYDKETAQNGENIVSEVKSASL